MTNGRYSSKVFLVVKDNETGEELPSRDERKFDLKSPIPDGPSGAMMRYAALIETARAYKNFMKEHYPEEYAQILEQERSQ